MNKLFLVVLFTFSSLFAMAVKKTPSEKAKEKTEEMQKDLQLTSDQNKKIYDINLKAYTSIAEYDAKNQAKN